MKRSSASAGAEVNIQIDGHTTTAAEGQTIAALLMSLDVPAWRLTSSGEPRGAFCGIGVCFDCVVTVDGVSGVKACLAPVREGMQVLTQRRKAS